MGIPGGYSIEEVSRKVKYKVVFAPKLIFLEQKVEELLDEGWECQGGLCVDDDRYMQAMVLK